ncbi:hypothetical protein ASF49_00020 [Methylobacterium sp. Leaf104]|uniref:O-antigen ligase family protein n=1 Tax=Methylobacterium TaxID=407 RepID=UPI0006FD9437|nr:MULTISPECIES: O-antigen ligase family protein [Methylobacterium]KQP42288.1 hypothetical protein ASF49_00020 [Methylobacterium sp. Leaf104]MCI9879203.1 O-antigen ligase family protein [Methylobacterium goesingense]
MVVAYGSIGRDVFFNRLNDPNIDDPIGAVLVYIRFGLCALTVMIVVMTTGLAAIRNALPLALLPYLVLAMVSFVWADDTKGVLRAAIILTALYFAMSPLILRLGREKAMMLLVHVIAVVVILSTLLAVFLPSIGTHTGEEMVQASHGGRWRGLFSHKNGLGPWGAFGTIIFLFYPGMMRVPRLYTFVALVCAAACLIFSGSATSLIGAVTMLIALALLRINRAGGPLVTLVAFVGGLFAGVILLTLFYDQFFGLIGRDSSFTGRTEIWEIAIEYIKLSPILGHGYQSLGGPTFLEFVASYAQQAIQGPESLYLASLLDLGIVGFTLFFLPIVMALVRVAANLRAVRSNGERDTLEAAFLIVTSALFMGITETTPFVCTGFDGVVCFVALFVILQFDPRSNVGRVRSTAAAPVARRSPTTLNVRTV